MMKPMSFEEALALYDEEPSGEVEIKPIENPEDVFESEEGEKRD